MACSLDLVRTAGRGAGEGVRAGLPAGSLLVSPPCGVSCLLWALAPL